MTFDKQERMLTIERMTKNDAIKIFGSVKALAKAYGCERQAIYQWPEVLSQGISDRVIGAALRAQVTLPELQSRKADT